VMAARSTRRQHCANGCCDECLASKLKPNMNVLNRRAKKQVAGHNAGGQQGSRQQSRSAFRIRSSVAAVHEVGCGGRG
jgi:hypothetical protein